MKIEIHLLQNFAPSNLNRDDTGAPKDCEFGGYRRARISSQCLKRAMREAFAAHSMFGPDTSDRLAARTKRLVDEVAKVLASRNKNEDAARQLVTFALQSAELKVKEERKTEYLLFVPHRLITGLADLTEKHWAALADAAPKPTAANEADDEGEGSKRKTPKKKGDDKKAAKSAVPKPVVEAVDALFEDTSKTPDLALFGRMIADNPDWNVDAACQVAHAISTNRISVEFDFFTAVDDLKPKETAGSDMMGTVAFQSGCFYRYACLDVDALTRNLGGADAAESTKLTKESIDAFLRASALAIPTGKQNSMAAQNLPSYLLAVVRERGAPQSLANAFVKPVRPTAETSLVEASVGALQGYLSRTLGMWGSGGLQLFACGEVDSPTGAAVPGLSAVSSFDAWVRSVVEAAGARA